MKGEKPNLSNSHSLRDGSKKSRCHRGSNSQVLPRVAREKYTYSKLNLGLDGQTSGGRITTRSKGGQSGLNKKGSEEGNRRPFGTEEERILERAILGRRDQDPFPRRLPPRLQKGCL